MHRLRLCVFAAAIFAVPAFAAVPELAAKDIQAFLAPSVLQGEQTSSGLPGLRRPADERPILLVKWENDARAALGDNDVPHAAALLAEKYGLSTDEMAELLKLWVLTETRERWLASAAEEKANHELDFTWVRLASDSGYKPLVLQAMTYAIGQRAISIDCQTELLDKLVEKATDKIAIGWEVVRQKRCSDGLQWLLNRAGQRKFAPLVAAVRDDNLDASDRLAIFTWLISEAGLRHIDPHDRMDVRTRLTFDFAMVSWQEGLGDDGIAAVDALPIEQRERFLAGDQNAQAVRADGLTFDLFATNAESFRINYVAALLKAGRIEEARRVFTKVESLAPAQKYLTCHPGQAQMSHGDPCGDPNENFTGALLLDAFLGSANDKLGSIAQTFFSDERLVPTGVLWTGLSCRAFDPRFPQVCRMMRKMYPANPPDEEATPQGLGATAAARDIPGFAATREQFRKKIIAVRRQYAPEPEKTDADACAFFTPNFINGKPFSWPPGQPGRPLSYRDPRSGISFYVESDGRHLAALSPDGVLLWTRNPFEDSKLCPYRNARPIIVAFEPWTPAGDPELERIFKRKARGIGIRFDSSQFGVVDIDTGDFVFLGQN